MWRESFSVYKGGRGYKRSGFGGPDKNRRESALRGERIESLRILSPGVYELNLDALLERKGIIMGIKENGSYAIHLPSLFEKKKARRG
jgi:Zn-ribbon containing protein